MHDIAEGTDAFVVVVGPDARPPDQRAYALDAHECCALHLEDHSVFVVPKDYGIRREDAAARARARSLSEHEAIDSLKSLWGGTVPFGAFSLQEAVVVARELLNRSYVMLMKEVKDGPPRVGYLMDLVEWRSMKRTLDHHAAQKPQYAEDFQDQYLCRALRVQILGKGRGVRVETRVIDLAEKTDLKPALCRVGTWQRRLWEETAGRIPDEVVGCVMRHRDEHPKANDCRHLEAGIDDKARENLFLLMMTSYWSDRRESYENRSVDFAEQFGRYRPQKRGNIRNVLGRLGCGNPSPSSVPSLYKDLRAAARGKTGSMELYSCVSWHSVVNDRDLALRLLSLCLPVKIGALMLSDL